MAVRAKKQSSRVSHHQGLSSLSTLNTYSVTPGGSETAAQDHSVARKLLGGQTAKVIWAWEWNREETKKAGKQMDFMRQSIGWGL